MDRESRYARSYSKRHKCVMTVEEVVGGFGKGRRQAVYANCRALWWPSSVVLIVERYENGKKVDIVPDGSQVARLDKKVNVFLRPLEAYGAMKRLAMALERRCELLRKRK